MSSQATAGEIYFPAKLNTYVVFGIFYNYNTLTCAPGVTITASMVEQNGATHGVIALNGTETVPVTAGPEAGSCQGQVYTGTPVFYEWTDTSYSSLQDAFQILIYIDSLHYYVYDYTASIDATEPDKSLGDPKCACGDPIDVASGNVYEAATDYKTADGRLAFTRSYNSLSSQSTFAGTLGARWRSNYDRYLHILLSNDVITGALVERPDGQIQSFSYNGGVFTSDSDVSATLVLSGNNYIYTDPDDTVETYNVVSYFEGLVTQIVKRGGYTQNLVYNKDFTLASVTDMYGRALTFTYTSGLLTGLTTADSTSISYGYVNSNVLATVSFPTSPVAAITYQHTDSLDGSLITGLVDENGALYSTWTYDNSGRGLSSQLAGGANLTTISYDDSGTNNRTVTNAFGVADSYTFTLLQGVPKVASISRASTSTTAAATRSFTYDTNGYLASSTDWNGNLTTFVNDANGNITSEVDASGTSVARTTTTTWSATLHVPTSIATSGITTSYTYDSLGNASGRRDVSSGLKRSWTYVWNNSTLTSVTGPRTDVTQKTSFTYANGALTSTTDAAGHVTRITSYTAGGLPLTQADPNNVTTTFTYDSRQRLLSRAVATSAGKLTTSFTYDAAGNLLKTQLPDGSYIASAYDNAHRLTMSGNAVSDITSYTLDALGDRTATAIGKSGGAVTWKDSAVFDALGRKITDVQGASQTTSFAYDAQGQVLTVTAPLTRVTTQVFDALGRISSVKNPLNGVTSFTYDAHDRILKETAPNGAVTQNTYDGFGRLKQKVSPDSGTTLYTYDLADNLTQSQDASSVVTNYSYDALNRITGTTYPADTAENVAFAYDQASGHFGIGLLTGLTDPAGSVAFTYDERGNQLSQVRFYSGLTGNITTTYDAANRVASITYPSGNAVTYTRNAAGEITAVSGIAVGTTTATPLVSGVSYMPFGPISAMTYGNGLAEKRSYDLSYRLAAMTSGSVQSLSYTYDKADRVTAIADSVNTVNSQQFGYDKIDELTSASGAYGSDAWTYDASGNRATQTAAGVSSTYSYVTKSNVLTSIVTGGSTTSVATSPAGNIITETSSAGNIVTRIYNKAERLSGVQIGGAQVATYTYDAFGNRLGKALTSSSVFSNDDQFGHRLEDSSGTGTLMTDYVYLNGTPIAEVTPNAVFFLHTDRLGTPQVATTTTGAVAWQSAYQPFGLNTGTTGLLTQNLRFLGQYYDAETGDHQNGFRDYDPTIGRYLETDPIGLAGGINTYAYVGNNPVNFTDPLGLAPPEAEENAPPFETMQEEFDREGREADTYNSQALRQPGPGEPGGPPAPKSCSMQDRYDDAQERYPNKRGYENHHITPKYLGGDPNGPMSRIPSAYHQDITNAFRNAYSYGQAQPSSSQLQNIMSQVYSQYPLPP